MTGPSIKHLEEVEFILGFIASFIVFVARIKLPSIVKTSSSTHHSSRHSHYIERDRNNIIGVVANCVRILQCFRFCFTCVSTVLRECLNILLKIG